MNICCNNQTIHNHQAICHQRLPVLSLIIPNASPGDMPVARSLILRLKVMALLNHCGVSYVVDSKLPLMIFTTGFVDTLPRLKAHVGLRVCFEVFAACGVMCATRAILSSEVFGVMLNGILVS